MDKTFKIETISQLLKIMGNKKPKPPLVSAIDFNSLEKDVQTPMGTLTSEQKRLSTTVSLTLK